MADKRSLMFCIYSGIALSISMAVIYLAYIKKNGKKDNNTPPRCRWKTLKRILSRLARSIPSAECVTFAEVARNSRTDAVEGNQPELSSGESLTTDGLSEVQPSLTLMSPASTIYTSFSDSSVDLSLPGTNTSDSEEDEIYSDDSEPNENVYNADVDTIGVTPPFGGDFDLLPEEHFQRLLDSPIVECHPADERIPLRACVTCSSPVVKSFDGVMSEAEMRSHDIFDTYTSIVPPLRPNTGETIRKLNTGTT